jgi:hypothetical protein
MSHAELDSIRRTGTLDRGGRPGDFFVTPSTSKDPLRARQRLALPSTPEVRVRLSVPARSFGPWRTVAPYKGMPGGGIERVAPGNCPIPASILHVFVP